MFVIYGIRNIRIRTIRDEKATCSNCGHLQKEYRVYQPCVHIFWIPFFPIPGKYVVESCPECKSRYETREHPLLNVTRTPIYTFALTLILLVFFANIFIESRGEKARNMGYISEPLVGDVYLMKDSIDGERRYYFTKVDEVTADSVLLLVGAYEYTKYVSRMDTVDYYVDDYYYVIARDMLSYWWKIGRISDVKRIENKQK